jgi:glycosyltransferase involved in cell wall biosynthesis
LAELTRKRAGKDCLFLPNPIDLNLFSPGDRREARRHLGLPEEGILILAGADSLEDRRKGFDLLSEAWSKVGSGKGTLVLFGGGRVELDHAVVLGALRSDEQMISAYRAANLYVHTARQENAPCTIQESLACGTPVLAFGVGGIPEVIQSGQNGVLVRKVDGSALADDLEKVLRDTRQLEAMRPACRQHAEMDYSPAALLEKFFRFCPGSMR